MIFNAASVATALVLFGSFTTAAPMSGGRPGQIVQIASASSWCMMMPPEAGGDIAANEDRAIAFCTSPDLAAPQAKIFPEGFIQSAHFASGDGYVQITGKLDSSKYSLSPNDQGGQYDIKAPVGSSCAGYNYYVNLIEPHSNTMCIRCCKEKKDCNTGKSTYGCAVIVPGDYSGPESSSASVPTTTSAPVVTGEPTVSSSATALPPVSTPLSPSSSAITPTMTTAPTTTTAAAAVSTSTTATAVSPTISPNVASTTSQSFSLLAVAALGAAAMLAL
ncbi:hypothetical protein FBU30_003716 [Linnemannia zychae]|nr:hypothetical protein FBU30_003716 [Linnemannia zychae]